MALTEEMREYHRDRYRADPQRGIASTRAWQAKNKTRINEQARQYRKSWSPERRAKNLAAQRARTFLQRYGLTHDDYEAMLARQKGCCALCNRLPEQERYKRLNVDHCHTTKVVRGLLCTPCNHALGMLGDNAVGLARALKYVSK